MLKILFIDSEPYTVHGGGIRTYLHEMLNFCMTENIETKVLTHSPHAFKHLPPDHVIQIQRKPIQNSLLRKVMYQFFYPLNLVLEYSHWISQELSAPQYDKWIFEYCDYNGYGFYPLKDKKRIQQTIIRIHTPHYLIQQKKRFSLAQFLLKKAEKTCLQKAMHLSAPSKAFIEENLNWIKNFTYIPNPLPHIKEDKNAPSSSQNSLLYIGRIEERKGVLILIKAFKNIAMKYPSCHLTLAGQWLDTEYCKNLSTTLNSYPIQIKNRIHIKGELKQKELYSLIEKMDICLFPSLWENCPYAYFEALGLGKYTITSQTGEMGDVNKKLDMMVAKPNHVPSLTKAIDEVLSKKKHLTHSNSNQREFLNKRKRETHSQLKEYFYSISA